MPHTQSPITTLFPGLTPEEQNEARHALRRYLSFILRLYTRIASDPAEYQRLAALTPAARGRSMKDGRTFTSHIPDTDA